MVVLAFLASLLLSTAQSSQETPLFQLPRGFEGTWQGLPYASVLGPWSQNNMTFAISRAASGDYLMVTNLKYDATPAFRQYWSWQRSYIKSQGNWSGSVLHCPGPRSPSLLRQAMMQAHAMPGPSDRSVTFCLRKWEGYQDLQHPFPFSALDCYDSASGPGCGCFNWTLRLDDSGEGLDYQVSMAGTPGYARSRHLWARFRRIHGPPPVTVQMPGDGADFRCEYGSRDGHIVDGGDIAAAGAGCPFLSHQEEEEEQQEQLEQLEQQEEEKEKEKEKQVQEKGVGAGTQVWAQAGVQSQGQQAVQAQLRGSATPDFETIFPHCYVLNAAIGVVLEWELSAAETHLHVRISSEAIFGDRTYVAVGFRPLAGASTAWALNHGSGREFRFGMGGADIVLGHAEGFQRMYARQYTGAPRLDTSLQVDDVRVGLGSGRVSLEFVRPVVSGYLQANFGLNESILSDFSDMLWAVGEYSSQADFPLGHGLTRGWREVNWTDPEFDARPLESLRPYKCVVPARLTSAGSAGVSVPWWFLGIAAVLRVGSLVVSAAASRLLN